MFNAGSHQRILSVARKEMLHIFRDRQTLFMTLFFPIVELMMLGFAIDTNVRDVKTVVLDHDQTQASRALLRAFQNSKDFQIVATVSSQAEMQQAIVDGRARVGIEIPPNYSRRLEEAKARRLMEGEPAQILILVDGTVSSVA